MSTDSARTWPEGTHRLAPTWSRRPTSESRTPPAAGRESMPAVIRTAPRRRESVGTWHSCPFWCRATAVSVELIKNEEG